MILRSAKGIKVSAELATGLLLGGLVLLNSQAMSADPSKLP